MPVQILQERTYSHRHGERLLSPEIYQINAPVKPGTGVCHYSLIRCTAL